MINSQDDKQAQDFEELPPPTAKIQSISELGAVILAFDQKMAFKEIFGGFNFESTAEFEEVSEEELDFD